MKGSRLLTCCFKLLFVMLLIFSQWSQATEDLPQAFDMRVGFFMSAFPDLTRTDLDVALYFWTEKFSKQAGISVKAVIYESLETMRADFYQDKINIIIISPLLILNNFDYTQLKEGFKIVYQGSAEDELLVLTHKQSAIHHVNQIQKKRVSLLLNEPISKLYADTLSLNHFGKSLKKVVKKINYATKSSRLIYSLFFQETDIIFVYKRAYQVAVELNPQIGLNTQVIASLPHIVRGLGFFHHRVDPAFRKKVLFEAERVGRYSSGQQLLDLFYIDQVVPSSKEDIQTIKQLQQKYLYLIKQAKHK